MRESKVWLLSAFRGAGSTSGETCGRAGVLQALGYRGVWGFIQAFRQGRCLRMRSWLREADQAIGDWYMKNEDFTLWLYPEV